MNTPTLATTPPAQAQSSADTKAMIGKDIRAKWDKFSDQDVSSFKSKDELVTQVVAKYGTEKGQALREVDTVLNGRALS
ncbi:MAG: hypothetical protein JNJ53_13000 [Rhizobiales bacterium]|nr:hypothetical protein [Hyphomicrobiales bacterium]